MARGYQGQPLEQSTGETMRDERVAAMLEQRKRTPIAIFTYNRPHHVQLALSSLRRCARLEEVDVHIFCDGAKGPADESSVNASRSVVATWAQNLGAVVDYSPVNRGPDRAIVRAVSRLCAEYGRVIVLEDDHVVSPDFLDYMLTALDRYQDERRVYQISGFMFPIETTGPGDAHFLPLITARGWATWERAWRAYDWKTPGVHHLFKHRFLRYRFDYGARFPWSHVLHDGLLRGEPNWDTVWYWCVFRRSGLVLFPSRSLVWVGGWDGTGVHCGSTPPPQDQRILFSHPRLSQPPIFPSSVEIDRRAFHQVKRFAGRAEGSTSKPLKWLETMIYDELIMYHPRLFAVLQPLRRMYLPARAR